MAGGVHGRFVGAVADRAAAINDRGYMARIEERPSDDGPRSTSSPSPASGG
jgi:hypothetical protein